MRLAVIEVAVTSASARVMGSLKRRGPQEPGLT